MQKKVADYFPGQQRIRIEPDESVVIASQVALRSTALRSPTARKYPRGNRSLKEGSLGELSCQEPFR
jgi:hypothetical protein